MDVDAVRNAGAMMRDVIMGQPYGQDNEDAFDQLRGFAAVAEHASDYDIDIVNETSFLRTVIRALYSSTGHGPYGGPGGAQRKALEIAEKIAAWSPST